MYAIIKTGGKQYKVEKGDEIYVELLKDEADAKVSLEVVAIGKDGKLLTGADAAKAKVSGKVIKSGKQKKIRVFTYKPKKGKSRLIGHRQPYTKIQITSITMGRATKAAAEAE